MSVRQFPQVLAERDEIVAAPPQRGCEDHSFELPSAIYVAMGALFFGFVGVLGAASANAALAVPLGVIVAFLIAFFAVPAIFTRTAPAKSSRPLSWSRFAERGIETATGRESAASATVLVLLLPFLIFCFAIAVAAIAALV